MKTGRLGSQAGGHLTRVELPTAPVEDFARIRRRNDQPGEPDTNARQETLRSREFPAHEGAGDRVVSRDQGR